MKKKLANTVIDSNHFKLTGRKIKLVYANDEMTAYFEVHKIQPGTAMEYIIIISRGHKQEGSKLTISMLVRRSLKVTKSTTRSRHVTSNVLCDICILITHYC